MFNAIRAVHPYTPILIFGGMRFTLVHETVLVFNCRIHAGHSHIRDCQQYDGRTMALESGRYMETIGSWISSSKGQLTLIGLQAG